MIYSGSTTGGRTATEGSQIMITGEGMVLAENYFIFNQCFSSKFFNISIGFMTQLE